MKLFKSLFVVIALSALTMTAQANSRDNGGLVCPSACVNLSNNSMYDGLCSAVGQAQGRAGCQQYANFGCSYQVSRPVVVSPAQCYNAGNQSIYDSMCMSVGQARGREGCQKYANLGCAWQPAQYTCSR